MGSDGRTDRPSRYQLYRPEEVAVSSGWRQDLVHPPSRLFGSNGIRQGPDGRIWITEFYGDQITAWTPATDDLALASPMDSELGPPDDLVFDGRGGVYVTETMNGRVSGRLPTGRCAVLVPDCPGANGITITPEGDALIVDEMREGGRILRVSLEAPDFAVQVVAEGLDWLNACSFGPDGLLYFPQVFAGRVVGIDVATGRQEKVIEGLAVPTAVKFDAAGRLVVAEAGNGQVVAIALDDDHIALGGGDDGAGRREVLACTDQAIDNICFSADGHLYVSNYVDPRVEQWTVGADRPDRVLGTHALAGPYDIALGDDGRVLVADANSLARLPGDGRVDRLTRLLVDQDFVAVGVARAGGKLGVLTLAGDVFVLDPDSGAPQRILGATGDLTDQLLSIDRGGAGCIADDDGVLVVGTATDGDVRYLGAGGERLGTVPTGLPSVNAVDRAGSVLVAACAATGQVVAGPDTALGPLDGFERPVAVGLVGDRVAVVDGATRTLSVVDRTGGGREVVAERLPVGMPAAGAAPGRSASLVVDGDAVLVGCDGDGSIRRFTHR